MNRTITPRTPALVALAVGLAVAISGCSSTASSGAGAPRAAAVGHPGCFDPAFARGFQTIDDDVLLVDAGSNHYRVQLDATCFRIEDAAALQFKGDSITGRICGRFGDSVRYHDQDCRIHRVDWITPDEHAALLAPKPEPAPTQE